MAKVIRIHLPEFEEVNAIVHELVVSLLAYRDDPYEKLLESKVAHIDLLSQEAAWKILDLINVRQMKNI